MIPIDLLQEYHNKLLIEPGDYHNLLSLADDLQYDLNAAHEQIKAQEQEITRLKSFGCELNKNYIRLDDSVVNELVEALECYADSSVGQPKDYDRATKALSAYDARVKEVSRA